MKAVTLTEFHLMVFGQTEFIQTMLLMTPFVLKKIVLSTFFNKGNISETFVLEQSN